MKKIIFLIIGILLFDFSNGHSQNADSNRISIMTGFLLGYNHDSKINGEINGSLRFNKLKMPIELKIGFSYNKNTTDYNGVEDIHFDTYSLVVDGNIYLIKNFYTGLRITSDNNRVDAESQFRYLTLTLNDIPNTFKGSSYSGQIGYCKPIIKQLIYLRIQGQIGVRYYNISSGTSNTSLNGLWNQTDTETEDKHSNFLYNLSIGLGIRIK